MLTAQYVSKEARIADDALASRLNTEDHDPDVDTEQGHHPEGRKRGGLVSVYVEGAHRAFYDETDCSWCGYDN